MQADCIVDVRQLQALSFMHAGQEPTKSLEHEQQPISQALISGPIALGQGFTVGLAGQPNLSFGFYLQ